MQGLLLLRAWQSSPNLADAGSAAAAQADPTLLDTSNKFRDLDDNSFNSAVSSEI